jgi:peroxiredoxin
VSDTTDGGWGVPVENLPAEAPDFKLDHILGHSVSLGDYRGRTVVVVFGGKDSAPQLKEGIKTIRAVHGPDELPIIGVSDLQGAPRAARIIVKSQLKKAYAEAVSDEAEWTAAAGKPAREDPSKDVVMLMDWSGDVVGSYGLTGVDREAIGVVIDGSGKTRGSGSGTQLGDQVLAVLAGLGG